MKALGFKKFGGPEVVELLEVPVPKVSANQVKIKISYSAINPVDWKIREGHLQAVLPHELPVVLGWDAAGVVTEVGSAVKRLKIGDEVYAYARTEKIHAGTFAEFIVLPETSVTTKPQSVRLDQAAAVPLTSLTAWQMLTELAKIRPGEQVLILNGAGGVGSFAIQFAKVLGAKVTTTASGSNTSYVKELGADHVIDYTLAKVTEAALKVAPQGFDVIIDAIGGASLREAKALIKTNGTRIVSIVEDPAPLFQGTKTTTAYHFVYGNASQLAEIAQMIDQGKVQLPAIEVRSIANLKAALADSQNHHVKGKIVIKNDFTR